MKTSIRLAVLLYVAVLLAGCGSSEPPPSKPAASPTTPEVERPDSPSTPHANAAAVEHEPDQQPTTPQASAGRLESDPPDDPTEPVAEPAVEEPATHDAASTQDAPAVMRAIGSALRTGFTLGLLEAVDGPDAPVGMIVVYEVDADSTQPGTKPSNADMQALFTALQRRLTLNERLSGVIRQRDDGRIEVHIFRDDPDAMQRLAEWLPRPGTLEFRILANEHDHDSLIQRAEADPDKDHLRDDDGNLLAWWVPVDETTRQEFAERAMVKRTVGEGDDAVLELLVVNDPFNVTGAYLRSAQPDVDPRGKPCVRFALSRQGGRLFGRLTGNNLPDPNGFAHQLGIILDGHLYSAPNIQSTIFDEAVIQGQFTGEEVQELAGLLNTGSLPVPIRQVEKRIVQPEAEPAP